MLVLLGWYNNYIMAIWSSTKITSHRIASGLKSDLLNATYMMSGYTEIIIISGNLILFMADSTQSCSSIKKQLILQLTWNKT